jgi:hypothetical protein
MKLQSALEYLITYSWAIIIIAIVAVAIFEVLSLSNPVEECTLPAGFFCPVMVMSQNGLMQLDLVQSTQYPIEVTAIGCMTPSSFAYVVPINNPPANTIPIPVGSNYTFSVQCYSNGTAFSGPIKSIYSGSLIINYTNGYTNLPNTIYGSVRVSVTR